MYSYETIKSSIRLLLKSAIQGLTLDQLNADFRHYYQMQNIPYEQFGHRSLLNFLRAMNDIVNINENVHPLIVSIREKSTLNVLKSMKITEENLQEKLRIKVFYSKNSSSNDKKMKPVKRLVLKTLSSNIDRWNHRNLVSHFNRLNLNKNSAENFYSYNLFHFNIDRKTQCQLVRYSDGKFYIPCHELAALLKVREDELDRETMFSRVRIYPQTDLYKKLEKEDHQCSHRKNRRQPFRFLFLLSSVVSLLKMKPFFNRYSHLVLPFEKLLK